MKKALMILITAGLTMALFTGNSTAYEFMGMDIHGFVSQGYLQTTKNNFIADSDDGSLEYNEIGINFGKELTDRLRVGLQLFARDFGETENTEPTIDWAYADYRFRDWFGLRFGQIKTPHGLYNETRDIDMLRNSIFLPQSVYQEVVRSVTLSLQGVGIYGYVDMDTLGGFSYQALYGTQTINQDSRMSEALIGYPSNLYDNDKIDVEKKYAGSIVWDTPLSGVRLGASYDNVKMDLYGHWNTTIVPVLFEAGDPVYMEYEKFATWVYSLEISWRNLILIGEYIQIKKEFEYDLFNEPVTNEADPDGWYAGLTYRFTDWFELGGYYSESHGNYDDQPNLPVLPEYYDYLKDTCVTTRFDLNDFWTFKLEYHSFTGAFGLSARDNPASSSDVSAVDFFEKNWSMFAAKLTVAF